jgi:hypothetical protein
MDTMSRLPRHLPRHLALATAALLLAAGLTACGDDEPTAQDPGGDRTTAAADETDEPDPEPTDDGSGSGEAPGTVTVPVYFAGETPQGYRLFREFRKVEADNPMEEAVALMVAGDALDPDYTTLWPDVSSFDSVAFSEGAGAIVAQVPDDMWSEAPGDMTPEQASLAVQQLVYTVQGIQQERLPVLVQQGADPATLFGIDTHSGLEAAPQLEVLAFMNVTTPEEGQSVGDTFTAKGVGSSFEATVLWEVRDESGAKVLDGFTTADGWMDKLYPWEAQVEVSSLDPGTYQFVAITDDPSDGEGAGPTEDSKTIVVS